MCVSRNNRRGVVLKHARTSFKGYGNRNLHFTNNIVVCHCFKCLQNEL